jgi:hypothetical protein
LRAADAKRSAVSLYMRNLLLVFALLIACESASAQGTVAAPDIVQGDANACELNAASFDFLANTLRENGERLFVIARLGRGETSRDFNRRRLHNVRTYFSRHEKVDAKRVVFAEGEPSEGEGRVEFYVGSKLMLVSLVKRGRDICVDCCDFDDPDYYGFGKKKDKLKRRKR